MRVQMKIRLSVMMFLEYFVWGAWYVTLGTWLGQQLHFSGQQIGLAAGTTAVGAMLSPFLVGLMADELFATQRLLAALHGIGGLLLFYTSAQTSFGIVYALLLLYSLCYMPTMALTNSLSFRQMKDPSQDFGAIRVLGTLGWIVAGLCIGFLKLEATAMPMRLAGASSLLMAVYCLSLPHTPPLGKSTGLSLKTLFPVDSVSLLKDRSFAVFALASFLICIPLQFYYAFTNPYLNEIGVQNAAGKMTMGQMSELVFMVAIPWFFRRLGVKYMLVAGMLAWVVRYAMFAYGNSGSLVWMLYLGILLHGICYDFFFVTGQIYVDRKAPLALRAAAQGFITFITYGAGMFLGSWLSGRVVDLYVSSSSAGQMSHAWRSIWLVPAFGSGLVLVLFIFAFSRDESRLAPSSASESPLVARQQALGPDVE